jgi:hypothetical protein
VSGSLTPRDVWKAYAMTVASQGTGAVSVDLLRYKLSKVGIDFNPPDLFTDTGKSGQKTIRPEEAAAYWLGTPEGKVALDNAEAGTTSASDWDGLVQVRKAYGDDRFKTFNVFSDKNLSKIPVVVDQLNQSKGKSKQVLDAVQLLNGVSTGKKGFISHLLGLGNTPTIDAVEINFWLTGKADVGTLKTKEADLARKVKDTFSDKRVREEMFNRIDNSISLLQGVAEGGQKVPRDVWAHVTHHWLWDKAKGLETTHAGMYEAQMRFMPEKLDSDYMKAVESGDVKMQQRIVDEAAISSVKEAYIPINKLKTTEKIQDKQVVDEIASKIENPDDVDWDYYPALIITPDMKVRDGHHRLEAFKKTGVDKARTLIVPYDIWKTEVSNGNLDGLVKWAANAIDDPVTGNQPNLYGRPIKNIDPITRDDSGNVIPPSKRFDVGSRDIRHMPEGYKSHHDETLLNSAWNGKELDLNRPFKANESLPSLAMRTKWEEKPLVSKGDFDFNEKARVIFGKNKNGDDVTFKFDPKLLNPPNIVDFADVYTGEQIQYTIADRMSAVDGDMGGTLHPFLKNNDIVIEGPDGQKYVVGWGNNSATVGTKMRRKAKDGANVLMVYLMGNDAHQSNTRTVRLFDTQLENSSKPGHMIDIARAYLYIPIKEIKHTSALKEVARIDGLLKKAKTLNKGSDYINKLKSDKNLAIKESQKFKVSAYETELAGIFRKVKSSQTRLDNGIGKQSTVDANIKELSDFASSKKGKSLIGEIPSQFIYEMTGTFDGRKSAVSQISNLKLYDFDGPALSAATADMESGDKNAIVTAIDLSNDQDFFMLYMGDDPKQINAMTSSEKAAAAKLKQNSNFVIHEAYDTLILSPLGGRRNLNSRMENALDAVPDSFQAVLDDRPNVKAQVGKTDAKGKLILSEDNLLNTVRDQQSVPLIYNPRK